MYLQILLSVVGVLLFLWYLQRRKCLQFFKKLGIPGPEPNVLFGNSLEIFRKGPIECQREWVKKYGRVVGYYCGSIPILLVSDVNILKKVLIKDFQKFVNRPPIFQENSIPLDSHDRRNQNLLTAKTLIWKHIRSLVTPSFSTGKMKLMSPIVNDCIDNLLENIEEKRLSGKSFNLYQMLKQLTLDVIARTAFGIQTNVQKSSKNPFLDLVNVIFSVPFPFFLLLIKGIFDTFTPAINIIRRLYAAIGNRGGNPVEELLDRCEAIIKARMNDPSLKRVDLLQLMIDAEAKEDDKASDASLTAGEEHEDKDNKDSNKNRKKRRLTVDQMVANTFVVLLAGFETTSTALAFTFMMLANYPEVQERIRSEVNERISKEGKLTYESVNQLEYLDQVFSEVLRLYPPVYQFVNREAAEDVVYDNIRIPKGTIVQTATYLLHYDPEYWPDPYEFKPERFSSENRKKLVSLAWQPFGAGPRNCVGMRFAQMESKLAIGRILHKYRILPAEGTDKHPLDLSLSPIILRPKYGAPIRVELV